MLVAHHEEAEHEFFVVPPATTWSQFWQTFSLTECDVAHVGHCGHWSLIHRVPEFETQVRNEVMVDLYRQNHDWTARDQAMRDALHDHPPRSS